MEISMHAQEALDLGQRLFNGLLSLTFGTANGGAEFRMIGFALEEYPLVTGSVSRYGVPIWRITRRWPKIPPEI
ncbi:MAG: hypothetical protein WCD12_11470 [Candidatus Binatus sp.]|uniref:hypothetical protein n=1 Tax=Candidatus Binatus sp. TaxID=2811406 RepID=UPI003C76CFD4